MSKKGPGGSSKKVGNKKRKPSAIRYKSENRHARHRQRNVERFEVMVAESRERRAS